MNAVQAAQLLEANEHLVLAVLQAQDEARQAAQALQDAVRSPPTGALADRPDGALLLDRLAQALDIARRSGGRLGLLFVSVDNFKEITDTLGHACGDEVLQLAARRLAAAVRLGDTVSRHGGNEFLVLLPAVRQVSDAISLADAIVAALVLPAQLQTQQVRLEASVGVSLFPDDGDDGAALIDRATAAMYSARRRGVASYFFRGEAATSARSLELRVAESGQPAPSRRDGPLPELISNQKEANEQLLLAAMRAQDTLGAVEHAYRRQSEFLVVVAHELRGPLGPITHAARLLGTATSQEPVLPIVRGVIERQVIQMARLVSDLLDTARISKGKLRVDMQPMDLAQAVREAVEDMQPGIEARAQALSVRLPEGALMVNADRLRLNQVLVNLVANASKYTQRGGLIELTAVVRGPLLVLTVRDNGIGISPEALQHVFDPFVQEVRAIRFNGTGLGIGLNLVRELVQSHGGQVVAASAGPGQGSRFTVTLPLLEAAPAQGDNPGQ